MEEDKDDQPHRMGEVKSVTAIGNSWIICRSQSHGGRIYYFNTLTGNAVWNLSDAEMKKAQLHTVSFANSGANIQNCPEPTEPPVDMPAYTTQPPGIPKIYNKQIINNQFSKSYTPSPFATQQCHNACPINHICDGIMNVWVPPQHQLFVAPAMPTCFQMRNFANEGNFHPQVQNVQSHHSVIGRNQRLTRNFPKSNLDLRNILSAKRRVTMDANCDATPTQHQETRTQQSNDHKKVQDTASNSIGEDDLYPSDIDDDWLSVCAVEDKSKLNIDVSSLRTLANGTENPARWFIVASAVVLLNHLKLLTSLANSDTNLLVLVPMEVRRRLRSATGSAAALGRRAQRANKWAALHTHKIPADLKSCVDGSIVSCCLDLVQRNYYVIHLTDDSDIQRNQIEVDNISDRVLVFTVGELKEYLAQNAAPIPPRNMTVTIFSDDAKESIPDRLPVTPQAEDTIPNTEVELPQKNEAMSDSSKEKITQATSAKKIKLKRRLSVKKDDSVKRPAFKWRKRRVTNNWNDNVESTKREASPVSSPALIQQNEEKPNEVIEPNDNAVHYGNSIETPKEKDIVMFKVTGDQMDDYLSKGSDEWLSRFVQIMEEALTQTLHQEPSFMDSTIPPPWSIQEATVCIKQKFKYNSNIVSACYKFHTILEEISDSRGKIYPNLDPARFMKMYSYGVNLIDALQSELKDSEDIQIALDSLSALLFDIRNPSVDAHEPHGAAECDNYDEPNEVPTTLKKNKGTPKKHSHKSAQNISPRKYNLRSAEKKKREPVNTDEKTSFFTELSLEKKNLVNDSAVEVDNASKTNRPPSPQPENNEPIQIQPVIKRNFNICPEYEERLKKQFSQRSAQIPTEEEFAEDDNCLGNKFYLEEDYGDVSEDEDDINLSQSCGYLETAAVFDWFVERTGCPMNKALKQIHKFCLAATEDLNQKVPMDRDQKKKLLDKTQQLNINLGSLCQNLNSVLQRKDTSAKFREMMQVLEIHDFVLTDAQEANYKAIIEKFLEQAGTLSDALHLLAAELV